MLWRRNVWFIVAVKTILQSRLSLELLVEVELRKFWNSRRHPLRTYLEFLLLNGEEEGRGLL